MQLNEMLQIPEEQWLPCYLRGYDRDSSKYVKPQRKRVKKDALKEVKCIDEVSTLYAVQSYQKFKTISSNCSQN